MAAYAALVSIMQIFDQIEHHPSPPITMDKKQVESLTDIVVFLQEFLEGYKSPFADGDEADPLEMRIADAVYAAEDAIESHIVDQILPATSACADLYGNLAKVIEGMDLIKKEVMGIVEAKDHLHRHVSASTGSSTSPLSKMNSTAMVGLDDAMLQLMEKITYGQLGRQVIPIVGMGGIGKTTLARNVYDKPLISHHFDICAWITISQQFNVKELLCEILSQANKQGKEGFSEMREDEIGLALHKCLSYRRYVIVLDDMWSVKAWEEMQCYFPDCGDGSRIVVTTRLSNLGSQLDNYNVLEMKFMDEDNSWNMFCKIVFGGESCPLELEKIGKKIVKRCRGLPLSIVVMGGLLGKMERTRECWKSIKGSINSLVNSENGKHCLKILKLSYEHLPVYLKPCFLYMGTYEEDKDIRISRVIDLWVCEGFLKPISGKSLETVAKEYLDELVDRNLILVHYFGKIGDMKYLKIHDLLRDLCLREAEKERFYHVVGRHSPQGMCSQRRIVIPINTSKKEVLDAMKSTPYARSYISDRESVPLLPNLKLLRILKVDSYEDYAKSLGKMVNLRLVDVNEVRSQFSPPWSLQTLIAPYHNGTFEIRTTPQLRHVHVGNGELHLQDHLSDNIVIMENLQILKRVKNFTCDETMVLRLPNIKKLLLIYDGTESRDDEYCVHNIGRLQKLESLRCYCYPSDRFLRKLTFPHSLKCLTLKIVGCRMEDILERVSTLPVLQKFKLNGGIFTTGKWETVEG